MKRVELPELTGRAMCDCGVHLAGRCDTDFPLTTIGLPYTDGQVRLMAQARLKMGLDMTDLRLARRAADMGLPVTFQGLPVTEGQICEKCGTWFEGSRSDQKFCSTKCRVASGRKE